ncbi:transcription cofactor vestigial-like protein 4b isoform X3 [Erpetoichthys calabaricus]|uniref:transcription cofactor vestigial-like protein 4b isoform X3 n=1 Tax=Erpetoichthys calabaricus TaxID=27687 RepID=UPI002233F009|nr:transcription cofactor vestigial-like protein 4b isoform X3 [Erpetoichthys calabaricus]
MFFTKMDLLNYQYLDKMNNNIGILCYEGEAALRGEPRMPSIQMSSNIINQRTGPPPISPSKRKYSVDQGDEDFECDGEHAAKMSRLFAAQLGKSANGDYRKDHRDQSRSPVERSMPSMGIHSTHLYTSIPSLAMDQPLALTKNVEVSRNAGLTASVSPIERQQNRPSVITCASVSNRNCGLSHCPVAHNGCVPPVSSSYRRGSVTNNTCDPVIEEHFRRSLGKNYKEPEPVTNSVSITGSVDDHFAKALGETWLQIKAAKDGVPSSPESATRRGQTPPSSHMVNHSQSPSVMS